MKKLQILKSLVDFIWVVSCIPLIPLLLVLVVLFFMDADILTITPWVEGELDSGSILYGRLYVLGMVILVYVCIYCFYLFRKTLRFFQKAKPFDNTVIYSYNQIGKWLSVSGTIGAIGSFLALAVLKNTIKLNLGITPFLALICLGLFFMVLSEIFKVAKHAKEENELTV